MDLHRREGPERAREPWVTVSRRMPGGSYVDHCFPTKGRDLIAHAVGRALHVQGGFEAIWQRTFVVSRLADVTERLQREADTVAADAEYLRACARLAADIAASPGAFTFPIVPSRADTVDDRNLKVKTLSPGYRPDWSRPSCRVMLGGEQVGWLAGNGVPVPMKGSQS